MLMYFCPHTGIEACAKTINRIAIALDIETASFLISNIIYMIFHQTHILNHEVSLQPSWQEYPP